MYVKARLAQLVERKALNLVVVGSSPTVGVPFFSWVYISHSSRFIERGFPARALIFREGLVV